MNELPSPFMDKVDRRKKKKIRKTIITTTIIVLVVVLTCAAFIFVRVDESVSASLFGSPTPGPTYVITPTPDTTAYKIEEAAVMADNATPNAEEYTSTPTPAPTLFIHPAVRDDKFTDGEIIVDDLMYKSSTLNIDIDIVTRDDSILYIAEVYFKDLDNFKPVFANGRFHNGYQTTSEMADEYDAIFAVNSDSATAVDYGIIVRYGEVYRDIVAADHLVVFQDGSIMSYLPVNINAEYLIKKGAEHVFCFGPRLFYNGEAITDFSFSHIRQKHPRTAIGMVDPYHYFIVVVDGRYESSDGMTLEALAKVMKDLGCVEAYNLDGGGSSTMVFMGKLINKPEGTSDERDIDSAILFVETGKTD